MKTLLFSLLFLMLGNADALAQERNPEVQQSPSAPYSGVLTVDLAQESVDITTGFNGAHLKLFGVQDKPGDIAVVISGPRRDMVVRQKEKLFGIWTNLRGIRFKDVPVYYDYALENPEQEEALREVLKAQGIGMAALRFPAEDEDDLEKTKLFQEALIRNKQVEGRFPQEPEKITFLNDHFFKTSFYIPPNVPTGNYKIQSFLIEGDIVHDVRTTDVTVGQVGVSAGIHSFARDNRLIYGLSCVAFAMFMGWVSNAIRNRA